MIDTLLKVTVLLVLVAVATQLLRRSSAALRHLMWTLAIVALVALPVLTTIVPFELPIIPTKANATAPDVYRSAEGTFPGSAGTAAQKTELNATVPKPFPAQAAADNQAGATPASAPINWTRLLVSLYIAVVIAMLARFFFGFAIVTRIARRAITITDESWHQMADRAARALDVRTPADLRVSDEVSMPFACGLIRPVIVLPASATEWSTERREAVLMHEYAHISRGDLAMNMLSHVVRAFYWFHPLAWMASHKLRVEGERACDDAVLRAGALPSDYAEHLLSIIRSVGTTVPNVALAMARRSDFEGRLLAILEPGVARGRMTRIHAAALAAVFIGAVMPLAAMSPARPPAPTAEARDAAELETSTAAPTNSSIVKSPSANVAVIRQATPPQATGQAAQSGTSALSALVETLGDASVNVRLAAVRSLGSLGDPRAIAALAKALKEDTDARVREAAAQSLGEIDDNRAVPALLDALRTERNARVKEHIIRALGEIDDASAVAGISATVKDTNVEVRRAAVWALGELEDPSAIPALIALAKDEDVEVRREVANSLGNLSDESSNREAFDPLMSMARDPDPEVRQSAISALGDFDDKRALPVFLAALKDQSPEVRHEAAHGIEGLELKAAPRELLDALSDSDADVRQSVAQALGNIGDEAAVPGLKRLTADPNKEVRQQAAEALSDIGGVDAVQALMGLLKDSDPEIRKIAAEALGKKRHD
jgi:HEAT repeat protein/beta-lactamase regulating signal transducer with metallopeptidase domain